MSTSTRGAPSSIPSEDPVESFDPIQNTVILKTPFEDDDWFYTAAPEVQTTFERDYWKAQATRLAGKANRLQERLRQTEARIFQMRHADRTVTRVVRAPR